MIGSALIAAVLLGAPAPGGQSVVGTEHDLSVSGGGTVRATAETQVCIFCHTPHDANPAGPLWNHQLSAGVVYLKYTSPTLDAYASQAAAPDPNGASKLCLSCHDGTVALGAVTSRPGGIPLAGGKGVLAPGDRGFIGTDLSKTHPISFVVTDQLVAANNAKDAPLAPLAAMRSDPKVHLDAADRVQCTSCHDPHSDGNYAASGVHFYLKDRRAGPCLVCHVAAPPDQGPHAAAAPPAPLLAPSRLASALAPPPPGASGALESDLSPAGGAPRRVAHASAATLPLGCTSCHLGHAPEEGRRALLLDRPERACLRCHGAAQAGEVAEGRLARGARAADVEAEFLKPSHHPVEWPGDHRPGERTPEADPNARRHVLCVDCHDAHGTVAGAAAAAGAGPRAPTTRRFPTEAAECLLCHGPAANRPARQPDVARQFTGISSHPVLGPGRGDRVPSLLPPYTTASTIGCTSCHGNDNPGGPPGPHGSIYRPLLVRSYSRDDNQPESPARYDLCYGCHGRASILSDASFTLHRRHVVDLRAPCGACHTAHGTDAPHLVEFDPAIVSANARGVRAFTGQGLGGGQCFLSCHGANHDPERYCAPGVPCPRLAPVAKDRGAPAAVLPAPVPSSLFPGWPGQ